ncbi:hypothetical protein GCM10012320_25860 [Sinomonas cellulolyticus]|nr:hypothetical protein GCM10012320_25860 [Sinomonas sp. KCTC 49339]
MGLGASAQPASSEAAAAESAAIAARRVGSGGAMVSSPACGARDCAVFGAMLLPADEQTATRSGTVTIGYAQRYPQLGTTDRHQVRAPATMAWWCRKAL